MEYWNIQDQVTQHKRDKNFDQALRLLLQSIAHIESENQKYGRRLYSWPYEQAAIIYRKQKQYTKEVDIIERYAKVGIVSSKQSTKLLNRLNKAYLLANQAEKKEDNVIFHIADQCPIEERPIFQRVALLVDTETTGITPQDELIQLGLIQFNYSQFNGSIIKQQAAYEGLRQPTIKIPKVSQKVHGLTDRMVKGKALNRSLIEKLVEETDVFIAHNAAFDIRYFSPLFPISAKKPWLCTMNGIKWSTKGVSSKALNKILKQFNIPLQNHHSAIDDAKATFALLQTADHFSELLQSTPIDYQAPINPQEKPAPKQKKKGLFSRLFSQGD